MGAVQSRAEKKHTYLTLLPLFSGALLILYHTYPRAQTGFADAFFCNGLSAFGYFTFLTFAGYYYAEAFRTDSKVKARLRRLRKPLLAYIAVILVYVLYLFAAGSTKETASAGAQVSSALAGVFTTGVHPFAWFLPAMLITLTVLCFTGGRVPRGVLIFFAAAYAFGVVLCSYIPQWTLLAEKVGSVAARVFQEKNCGVFSAGLFVMLGARLSEKKPRFSARTCALLFLASVGLCAAELVVLRQTEVYRGGYLFLSTAAMAYFLVSGFIAAGDRRGKGAASPVLFGSTFLCAGLLLCMLNDKSRSFSDSLLSRLFSGGNGSTELIFLFSLLASFAVCAFFTGSEKWASAFSNDVSSAVLLVLRLPARISGLLPQGLKNVLFMLSAAAMPVMLYFIERSTAVTFCNYGFAVCFAVIVFCTLKPGLTPGGTRAGAFSFFTLIAFLMFFSSTMTGISCYTQIARVMLYVIVPLTVVLSAPQSDITALFSSLADGLYLSFGIFFLYCIIYRPYDITRYKGPFCNPNMCGLYCVVIFAAALCRIPDAFRRGSLKRDLPHYIVAGGAFAFSLFTVSRTTMAGCAAALLLRIFFAAFRKDVTVPSAAGRVKRLLKSAVSCFVALCLGVIVSYACIRLIPAAVDMPNYLYSELTDDGTMENKVMPGAAADDPHYVSPKQLLNVWISRSVGSESLNDLSTGRLDIYKTFLQHLTLFGNQTLVMRVEGSDTALLAHNAYLQIAFNCGVVTGLLYLALIALLFFSALRRGVKGSAAARTGAILLSVYGVCGMFESIETFYYPILLAALAGIALILLPPGRELSPAPETAEKTAAPKNEKKKLVLGKLAITLLVLFSFFLFAGSVLQSVFGESHVLLRQLM